MNEARVQNGTSGMQLCNFIPGRIRNTMHSYTDI